jgi:hypothetical protein
MKTCVSCKQEKNDDDFRWRYKERGLRSSYCRSCRKQYDKERYSRGEVKKTSQESRERVAERNRSFILEALVSGCVDCGEKNPVVLEFDHQRDKIMNVSVMLYSYSLERIRQEVEKCEIVCANCHRIRTANSQNFWKTRQYSV